MNYVLKLFDTELLKFELVENIADPVVKILWIDDEKRRLLPLGMEISNRGLASWLKHRSIPKNRAYVNIFLAKCGLNPNRPMDVISVCKGLSLNDSYWITDDSYDGTFEQNNLYDNNFSQVLAWIAFTGYGSNIRSTFASSPEFTTNGMLPKCWRRVDGRVYLYKGATTGASNMGNEPYSEMYAYMLALTMGFCAIPYKTVKWKGKLCSVCELFTSKEISYVPVGRLVKEGGMRAVREYYSSLGTEFTSALKEMIVFDALICNTDRHYGNFGVLVDSHTNKIVAPAPLFDHGNSLFNLAGEENWTNKNVLQEYVKTLFPCVYEDFITEAKAVMDERIRVKVRKILTVEVKKSGRYNYSDKKLKLMSEIVRERAKILLE